MKRGNPKAVRRQILSLLYDRYQADPMHSLMPSEIYVETGLSPEDVTPAAFYLHERGLVDLMVGYNPPNFDAVRIAPAGIDLVEDRAAFNQQFPPDDSNEGESYAPVMPLLLALVQQIEASQIEGTRQAWLLEDVGRLRDALRLPIASWDPALIRTWESRVAEYIEDGLAEQLAAFRELQRLIAEFLDEDA